jgi:small subunit ribosomal protein S9
LPEPLSIVTATGKRKNAVARVRLKLGNGNVLVNGKPAAEYFPREVLLMRIQEPFEATGGEGRYDVTAKLHGGGVAGQADALRHGIARALEKLDEGLRAPLKRKGFLTRDARKKERKKYGQRGARARYQFSKR